MNAVKWFFFGLLLCRLGVSTTCFAANESVVELTHWWVSPGEVAALNVLADEVTRRGGQFVPSKVANFQEHRRKIIQSISLGYAPSVTHWLAGDELLALKKQGLLASLPVSREEHEWQKKLFAEVIDQVSVDGELAALPVGIHLWNRIYFNADIYNQLDLKPAASWSELLQQLDTINNAGFLPVVTGNDPWQLGFILDAILLEQGGSRGFQAVFNEEVTIDNFRELLISAFRTLRALKAYTSEQSYGNTWHANTRLMAEGGAAIQFMGDFAEGELVALGKQAGEDFLCAYSPGTQHIFYYGVDVFALLNNNSEPLSRGQQLLTEIVADPDVQARYIAKKGGLPVMSGVDMSAVKTCSYDTYQDWMLKKDRTVLPLPAGNSRLRMWAVQEAAAQVWNNPELKIPVTVDRLLRSLMPIWEQ